MTLSILLHNSPSGSYTQSISSICDFVSWLESQAPAPYPANAPYTNAFNTFNTIKQDAMKWFNSIYPNCIKVLDSISFADSQITPGLDTMLSVAEQLKTDSENTALHNILIGNAQMLYTEILKIKVEGDEIETASDNFFNDINKDFMELSNTHNGLTQELQAQQNNLSSLYAKLHAIASKSCPSQGDINACKSQIENQQALVNTLTNLMGLMSKAMSMASLTLQGLTYLKNFWHLVTYDTTRCLTILNATTTDPTVALEVDVQSAQNAWKELYNIASQTLAQLPQALKQSIS